MPDKSVILHHIVMLPLFLISLALIYSQSVLNIINFLCTGGSRLSCTAVKLDSCLARIFFQNLVSFFLYNLI